MSASGQNLAETCSLTDTNCVVACACIETYGGSDCSSTVTLIKQRYALRELLCYALYEATKAQDASKSLLRSSSSGLSQIISPFDMATAKAREDESFCLNALQQQSMLFADQQQIQPLYSVDSAASLIESISKLVDVSKTQAARDIIATGEAGWNASSQVVNYKAFTNHVYAPQRIAYLADTLQFVIDAVHNDMIAGENQRSLVSSNVRLALRYDDLDHLRHGTRFHVPLSAEEIYYGERVSSTPSVRFPETGLDACGISQTHFVRLALSTWGFIPFENSHRVIAPLLRYSATLPPSGMSSFDSLQFSPSNSTNFETNFPFYYPMKWKSGYDDLPHIYARTYDPKAPLPRPDLQALGLMGKFVNKTFPSCAAHGGSNDVYNLCNINETKHDTVRYSNENVTYTFFDIALLCPRTKSTLETSAKGAFEVGAVGDIFTRWVPIERPYKPNTPVLSFFSVFTFFALFGAIYFLRWDLHDRRLASLYLSPKNKKLKIELKHHELFHGINAVLNSLANTQASSVSTTSGLDAGDGTSSVALKLSLAGEEEEENGDNDARESSHDMDYFQISEQDANLSSIFTPTTAQKNLSINLYEDDDDVE